jgi:YHS domain-containing protein
MNQERVNWLITIVMLLGFIGVGTVLHQQARLISHLSQQGPMIHQDHMMQRTDPEEQPTDRAMKRAPAADGVRIQDIALLSAPAAGPQRIAPNVQFIHRCIDGQVITKRSEYNGKTYSFCLGRNQLVIRDNDRETVVDDGQVASALSAPILMRVDAVANKPEDESSLVLVSYTVEPCTTTDDCGVGGPNNFVSFLYDLKTRSGSRIGYFPSTTYGNPVWNKTFSKAVFYPRTCGGAGCYAASLIGYDLRADKLTAEITRDKGVPAEESGPGLALTAAEEPQSTWGAIEWTSETAFRAQMTDPAGKTRWIQGQF